MEIGARAHDFKLQGIIEPGGKVIYGKEGAFDVETLKKVMFDDPMVGRI